MDRDPWPSQERGERGEGDVSMTGDPRRARRNSPGGGCVAGWAALSLLLTSPWITGCTGDTPQSAAFNPGTPASNRPQISTPSKGAGTNRPPVVREVRVLPQPLQRHEAIWVEVEGEDPDFDMLTFRYRWFLNDQPLEEHRGAELPRLVVERGQQVSVEVIPFDGKTEGAPHRTPSMVVANSPPEVRSLVLHPDPIRLGEPVTVQVEGFDADNDPVSYTFKWWKNGEPLYEGSEETFQTTAVVRGDVLVVQAVPRDSEETGTGRYSEPMEIGNGAPVITSAPPLAITDGRYQYRVQAEDPDDDPLAFTLAQAPPGMTIDPDTGLILWQITAQTSGAFPVRVAVEDGQGGQAYQEFTLNPLPPSPAADASS